MRRGHVGVGHRVGGAVDAEVEVSDTRVFAIGAGKLAPGHDAVERPGGPAFDSPAEDRLVEAARRLRIGRGQVDEDQGVRHGSSGFGSAVSPDPCGTTGRLQGRRARSEEHTSELQSLMRISYAVFCLKKKQNKTNKK